MLSQWDAATYRHLGDDSLGDNGVSSSSNDWSLGNESDSVSVTTESAAIAAVSETAESAIAAKMAVADGYGRSCNGDSVAVATTITAIASVSADEASVGGRSQGEDEQLHGTKRAWSDTLIVPVITGITVNKGGEGDI